MHQLPFGATLTEALVDVIKSTRKQCAQESPDLGLSLQWCGVKSADEQTPWQLFALERKYLQSDDILTVDGVAVHIAPDTRTRSIGKTLDWQKGVGVVEIETPTI